MGCRRLLKEQLTQTMPAPTAAPASSAAANARPSKISSFPRIQRASSNAGFCSAPGYKDLQHHGLRMKVSSSLADSMRYAVKTNDTRFRLDRNLSSVTGQRPTM